MSNNPTVSTVKSQLQSSAFKTRFLQIVNDAPTFQKEIAFAMMAIQGSAQLQQCSPDSIISAVFNVATTGLSLNPTLKLAALTPRYISGQMECVLFPMYQGLVKLVIDSGSAINIKTHPVYQGDDFEVQLGDEYSIKHSPKFQSKDVLLVYSIAKLPDGDKLIEYMTIDEILKVRESSDSYKAFKAGKIKETNVIWLQHPVEMYRKTVLRRIIKYIPKTDRYEKISEALDLDNLDFPADESKLFYIESLVNSSAYDAERRAGFLKQLESSVSNADAEAMINALKQNQQKTIQQELKSIQQSAKNQAK